MVISPLPIAPVVTPPGAGAVLRTFGDEIIVNLGGDETGGKFAMLTILTPPGGGPPPHHHTREDVWFYVLEGQASVLTGGSWIEAPAGSVFFMPRGSVHTLQNHSKAPVRFLLHAAPAGLEIFLQRVTAACESSGLLDMIRMVQVAAEHGIYPDLLGGK